MTGILNALIAGVSGAVKDAYFNLVSLLLPGNGTNGANNNFFLDSSSNNFTITRNPTSGPNAPTQGTFSPFSQTGWGNYLPTTSDRLTTSASNSGFSFGTGDFTIEGWMYPTAATEVMLFQMSTASTGYNPSFSNTIAAYVSASSKFEIYANGANNASTNAVFSSSNINQWHHFAIVRSSGTTKVYFDGTVITGLSSISDSTNYSMTYCVIGTVYDNSYSLKGYLSNLRVVKGRAVYTANFTPPTSPLGKTSGGVNPPQGTECVFLTAQSNRFRDSSDSNIGLNISGSPSVVAFSPFAPTQSYSASAVGGSGYFDGTGDYVQAASNAAFAIGTGDFAIECFVYFTGTAQGGGTSGELFGSTTTGSIVLRYKSGTLALSRVNTADDMSASVTLTPNQWYHICATRTGTTGALYLNGARVGTVSSYTASYAQGDIGIINNTQGYLTCCRLIKAANPYGTDTTITVPTAPLTAVSGTSLLLNFTNAGVVDATAKNVLETVGNAQISTTQSKWGGGSISFDGTGDWLLAGGSLSDLTNFGAGNFTLEAWVNFSNISSGRYFCGKWASSNIGFTWYYESNLMGFAFTTNGTSITDVTRSWTPSTGVWYYVAITRNGADLKFYVDGSQIGATYNIGTSSIYASTSTFAVGQRGDGVGPMNGYIDDFRITKGLVRTVTTVPTAPFPVQ